MNARCEFRRYWALKNGVEAQAVVFDVLFPHAARRPRISNTRKCFWGDFGQTPTLARLAFFQVRRPRGDPASELHLLTLSRRTNGAPGIEGAGSANSSSGLKSRLFCGDLLLGGRAECASPETSGSLYRKWGKM